jgi:hypothetical protein
MISSFKDEQIFLRLVGAYQTFILNSRKLAGFLNKLIILTKLEFGSYIAYRLNYSSISDTI